MGLKRIRVGRRGGQLASAIALVVALAAGVGTFWVQARTPDTAPLQGWAYATMAYGELPIQGRQVMERIRQGGPFRYEKDGTVFGNRERLLPAQGRGYYREYTVPTPGLSHRGARRIVCGGQEPRTPDACYYTEDHYASYRLIVQ
ncbi:MAG: ribonuclease domain-containing protein [Hydrogenophaga sp.]